MDGKRVVWKKWILFYVFSELTHVGGEKTEKGRDHVITVVISNQNTETDYGAKTAMMKDDIRFHIQAIDGACNQALKSKLESNVALF